MLPLNHVEAIGGIGQSDLSTSVVSATAMEKVPWLWPRPTERPQPADGFGLSRKVAVDVLSLYPESFASVLRLAAGRWTGRWTGQWTGCKNTYLLNTTFQNISPR